MKASRGATREWRPWMLIGAARDITWWQAAPAFLAAVLAISLTCLALVLTEALADSASRTLGYPGDVARIVAVTKGGQTGRTSLDLALDRYVADHRLSIAYTSSPGSGAVTVDDSQHRFRTADDVPLAYYLETGGDRPAAVVSTALVSAAGEYSILLPAGVDAIGTFRSDTQFEDRYPLLLLNKAATTYQSGIYIVAGLDDRQLNSFVGVLTRSGMNIVDASTYQGSSLPVVLNSPYGLIVLAFTSLVILAAFLVTLMEVNFSGQRLAIAAAIGALPNDLFRLTLRRLLPQVALGSAFGFCVGLAGSLLASQLLVLSSKVIFDAVLVSALFCILLWAVILTLVSWLTAKRVFLALSY